jgi:hypothetical protein
MVFAQMTSRDGLRDIATCLNARPETLYHLGFTEKVAKSTLAEANENRSLGSNPPADEDSAWRRGAPDSLTSRASGNIRFRTGQAGVGESSGPTPSDPAMGGWAQYLRGRCGNVPC